ncbi:15847_t:CDS:2 [Acaulospora colombiana]|uniref:15847_t:CDS:1 n=1 Tax=Acaulospora colombiana TaxID=27376 RepID=A0ACA9MP14_9GLOM|nr:15847_t:CDS:2 [Acaulospora colombiana]
MAGRDKYAEKYVYFLFDTHFFRPPLNLQPSRFRYKGISICFNILTKSFSGRYVNFGVFELYGDKALEVALNASFEMMFNVEVDDILAVKNLMEDVDFNLNIKNRDRFTQNLSTFKRELTNENVILICPPMDLKLMM